MEDVKKWLWEGVKTALRYFVIYAAPVVLDAGIQAVEVLLVGVPTLKLDPMAQWALRAGLAFADKVLHEWKKDTGSEGRWKGLIGF